MWIRSPAYDGFWLLSGVPLALALWATSPPPITTFLFILAFRVGHLAAPVACAWDHVGFRRLMLRHRVTFIAIPAALFLIAAAISLSGMFALRHDDDLYVHWSQLRAPAIATAIVYIAWNQWHLAMQNFGVLRLYAGRSPSGPASRTIDKAVCFGAIGYWTLGLVTHMDFIPIPNQLLFAYISCVVAGVLLMALLWRERSWPRIIFLVGVIAPAVLANFSFLYAFAAILVNHWLVAIGLAANVDGNHRARSPLWFAGSVMIFGAIVVLLRRHFEVVLAMNLGLSFVHYWYDRRLWKMSDPEVRATIGRDLFGPPRLRLVMEAAE
jgi:hypothetical protein